MFLSNGHYECESTETQSNGRDPGQTFSAPAFQEPHDALSVLTGHEKRLLGPHPSPQDWERRKGDEDTQTLIFQENET